MRNMRRLERDTTVGFIAAIAVAGFAMLFLVPTVSLAAQFVTPKKLAGFYESTDNVGPNELSLRPRGGSTTFSEDFIVRRVGPIQIQAGDCLDIRTREQFTTDNDADGWWTIGGLKSEHWSLYVAIYTGIWYSSGLPGSGNPGIGLRPEAGETWDRFRHHWHWNGVERECFSEPVTDMYLYTNVRFSSSSAWRISDDQFVKNDQRGKIEALHFR